MLLLLFLLLSILPFQVYVTQWANFINEQPGRVYLLKILRSNNLVLAHESCGCLGAHFRSFLTSKWLIMKPKKERKIELIKSPAVIKWKWWEMKGLPSTSKAELRPLSQQRVLALRGGRQRDGLRGIPRAGYVHAHCAKQKHRLKRLPSSCQERITPHYKVAHIISTLAKNDKA